MTRILAAAGLALFAAACASQSADKVAAAPPALLPTETFTATVAPGADRILLAAHKDGLSARQAAALDDLAERWLEAGGGQITVERPQAGGERMVAAVSNRLAAHGVRPGDIEVVDSAPDQKAGDVVAVGFVRDLAKIPACGRDWKSFTRSADNEANSNFGCAVSANIAAMVDNADDLAGPRPTEPVDAQRRQVVLGKYRSGDITSTTKDDKASGAVSNAVQ